MKILFRREQAAEFVLVSSLISVGIVGLFTPAKYNWLPANFVFEGTLFLCAIVAFRLPKRRVIFFFFGSILYVLGSFLLMKEFMPSNYLDFLQSFKAFIYVAPLCVFYNRGIFLRERMVFLFKVILAIFLLKYLYSVAVNINPRMGSRPGVYVENNFELIFLLLLFFSIRSDLKGSMSRWFALLALVVLLSGSRSSALALLVLFCGTYMTKFTLRSFVYFTVLLALCAASVALFMLRAKGGGVESVDRYRFTLVFLHEVSDWPFWKFLIGAFPITPLSAESCKSLAFYESLFSFSGDGSCYSVILHAYFLRAIFDHGILGLAFLFGFIIYSMRGCGYSRLEVLTVTGIISASALSVSAMNSVFVSLALMIFLGLAAPSEGGALQGNLSAKKWQPRRLPHRHPF